MTKAMAKTTKLLPASDQEAELSAAVARRIGVLRKAHDLSFDLPRRQGRGQQGDAGPASNRGSEPQHLDALPPCRRPRRSVADLVAPAEGPERSVTVVGPGEARTLWNGPSGGSARLLAGTPGPDMLEIWSWVLLPGERFEASVHGRGTRELIHVTEGSLALDVGLQSRTVAAGSTAVALTDRAHAYRNPGSVPVRFTMVVHEPPASNEVHDVSAAASSRRPYRGPACPH